MLCCCRASVSQCSSISPTLGLAAFRIDSPLQRHELDILAAAEICDIWTLHCLNSVQPRLCHSGTRLNSSLNALSLQLSCLFSSSLVPPGLNTDMALLVLGTALSCTAALTRSRLYWAPPGLSTWCCWDSALPQQGLAMESTWCNMIFISP